jgi:hypothetical protein
MCVRIGKRSGAIESLRSGGRELLAGALEPNFWRAPTDNDVGNKMPKRCASWKNAGPGRTVESLKWTQPKPETAQVEVRGKLGDGKTKYWIRYAVQGDGRVGVRMRIEPGGKLPEIPRIGMQAALAAGLETVTWLGRGPQETYWDRKTGGDVTEFRVKCGPKSGLYIHHIRVPAFRQDVLVSAMVPGRGLYFCVVAAANRLGESQSREIVLDVR